MTTESPSNSFASEERIRSALQHTWHAFFARFPRLRDVQRAAVMPILSGKSVLVIAPTAAGKTEAVMAPVLERLLRDREKTRFAIADRERHTALSLLEQQTLPRPATGTYLPRRSNLAEIKPAKPQQLTYIGPSILVVAPTKALCNDLLRRLAGPVAATGLSIAVRTGDAPNFNKEKPPVILITTPESLDSLLSRQPQSFLSLNTIVVDEIHLLSASGRGDQLQCLLARLRRMNQNHIACCASSATVPEVDRIAHDFLGDDAITLSISEGARDIAHEVYSIVSEEDAANIIETFLLESPTRKMIVFANARALVENLVLALKQRPKLASIVFAHHGSLSKEERLRTEKQFLEARHAVCVATSTLELGIDIGDVDRIVLVGPPADVSSLVQRIGRGNRKEKTAHVICLSTSAFDAKRFQHLVLCAKKDHYFPDPVAFRPTTIIQQALSICLQNPSHWVGKNALYERLSDSARRMYTLGDCEHILDALVEKGYLRRVERGKYVPESKTQFLFDRGYMHSMILDRGETEVIDVMTGRNLGSIMLRNTSKQAIEHGSRPALTLAGKTHAVSYMRDKKLFVEPSQRIDQAGFNSQEPPRYSLRLAQDFARYLNIPRDVLSIVPEEKGYRVDHYLGTVGACFISDFLTHNGCQIINRSHSPFFISINSMPLVKTMPDADQLKHFFEGYVLNNLSTIARLLQPGPWLGVVSEDLVQRWIVSSLDLDAYAKRLANLPIRLMPGEVNYDDI